MDFLSGGATVGMPRPTPAAPWIKADARGLVGHFGREKVQWHLASEGCAGLSSPGSSLGLEALLEKWGNGPKNALPEPQRQKAGAGTSNTGKSWRKSQPVPGSASTTRPAVKSHCLSRLLHPGANPQLQHRIWPWLFYFIFSLFFTILLKGIHKEKGKK